MAGQAKGGVSHEDIIRSVRAGEVKPVYLLMGAILIWMLYMAWKLLPIRW